MRGQRALFVSCRQHGSLWSYRAGLRLDLEGLGRVERMMDRAVAGKPREAVTTLYGDEGDLS